MNYPEYGDSKVLRNRRLFTSPCGIISQKTWLVFSQLWLLPATWYRFLSSCIYN